MGIQILEFQVILNFHTMEHRFCWFVWNNKYIIIFSVIFLVDLVCWLLHAFRQITSLGLAFAYPGMSICLIADRTIGGYQELFLFEFVELLFHVDEDGDVWWHEPQWEVWFWFWYQFKGECFLLILGTTFPFCCLTT